MLITHCEIMAAIAWCNPTVRSSFSNIYDEPIYRVSWKFAVLNHTQFNTLKKQTPRILHKVVVYHAKVKFHLNSNSK